MDSNSPCNSTLSEPDGAESGALALNDPDLNSIIDAWDKLPEALKAGILAMLRAAGV